VAWSSVSGAFILVQYIFKYNPSCIEIKADISILRKGIVRLASL
jgi:hypothetical protein